MILDLTDTNAGAVNTALVDARRRAGSPAMGMVLTLVIATDEAEHYDALRAANEAAREHPSRILVVVRRPGRDGPRLDVEVRVGGESGPGEVVLLRMYGPLADHADSVVLPLLLPDAPVVAWWPGAAPAVPAEDALGALAQRRVTDAAAAERPPAELARRSAGYRPGDTDLTWTRLTPWRTMLASALDEPYDRIEAAEVGAEADNASADLLASWLELRLEVPVTRTPTRGPGITDAVLTTASGPLGLSRPDGRVAAMVRPGQPERTVALPRRSTAELLSEELRRLDPDEVYGTALHALPGKGSAAGKGKGSAKAKAGSPRGGTSTRRGANDRSPAAASTESPGSEPSEPSEPSGLSGPSGPSNPAVSRGNPTPKRR